MIDSTIAPLLLAGIPLLGAAFSFVVWSKPDRLKNWSVVLSVLSLAAAVGLSGYLATPPEGLLLVYLLPVAACGSKSIRVDASSRRGLSRAAQVLTRPRCLKGRGL